MQPNAFSTRVKVVGMVALAVICSVSLPAMPPSTGVCSVTRASMKSAVNGASKTMAVEFGKFAEKYFSRSSLRSGEK